MLNAFKLLREFSSLRTPKQVGNFIEKYKGYPPPINQLVNFLQALPEKENISRAVFKLAYKLSEPKEDQSFIIEENGAIRNSKGTLVGRVTDPLVIKTLQLKLKEK